MALFGAADKNISPLTWAVQIDTIEDNTKAFEEVEALCKYVAPHATWLGGMSVQVLLAVCDIAYAILSELSESEGEQITKEKLIRLLDLNAALNTNVPGFNSDFSDHDGIARADTIRFRQDPDAEAAAKFTALVLINEVMKLFPDKVRDVRQCPVCNNPFVANVAKNQNFCSERCANRNRVREFRKRQDLTTV